MAYREETEKLRARVAELETELADAQAHIQALERRSDTKPRTFGERLLGAKLELVHERVVDGELSPDRHEELVEALRRRFNALGQASSVGRTLAWASAMPQSSVAVEVTVTARDGKTTVRAVERLGPLAGGLYGGIVGGVGGGGMGGIVPLAMALNMPEALPFLVVGWFASIYGLVRWGFKRAVASHDRKLAGVAEELAKVTETAIAKQSKKKLRVSRDDTEEEAGDEESEPETTEAPRVARSRRED
ncbi:MAG: hypothetical protein U0263_04925 [Polyangiaceae bacterium]